MKPIVLKAGTDTFFTVTDFLYYESEARAGCLRNTDMTFSVSTPSGVSGAHRTFDIREFRRFVKKLESFSEGTNETLRDPDHGIFLCFEAEKDGTCSVSGETEGKKPFCLSGITAYDLSLFVYRLKLLLPD